MPHLVSEMITGRLLIA